MKTKSIARSVRLLVALSVFTASSVAPAQLVVPRKRISSVQAAEIDRALDLMLARFAGDDRDRVRESLESQMEAMAKVAPQLERGHALWSFLGSGPSADLETQIELLAKQLVEVLRGSSGGPSARAGFKKIGEFAVLNGANAGDPARRWLSAGAKVGPLFALGLVLGIGSRWYGTHFNDPTAVEDGLIIMIATLASGGAFAGLTAWRPTRRLTLAVLAWQAGSRRRTADAMVKTFWRKVGEGLEGLPEFRSIHGVTDPAAIADQVRRVLVERHPAIFDECESLLQ